MWPFKKKVVQPQAFPFIQTSVVEPVESELKVIDYKLYEYKVYWETVIKQEADSFVAEVRFIGHGIHDKIRETHSAIGRSFEHAEQLAHKLIKEKMENFKV